MFGGYRGVWWVETIRRMVVSVRPARDAGSLVPGLVVVSAGVLVAVVVNVLVPAVSQLVAAVVLGAALTNLGVRGAALEPGLAFAARRLLRVGVVLLGAQLAVSDVVALGWPVLLLVLGTVAVTFSVTWWVGCRLGLGRGLSVLVATGFSICGAAAVAAMEGVVGGAKEDVVTAVALVTLYGSLAMVVLPLAGGVVGVPAGGVAGWAGASVHEVAQVVATAQTAGSAALGVAVVVKLTRVVLLAPLIAGVGVWRRRVEGPSGGGGRAPVLPLFVVGFLVMVGLRSAGVVPVGWLAPLRSAQMVLFAAALFAMGAAVRLRVLARTGRRAVVLGGLATAVVVGVSLAGVGLLVS
ncbi:putative sulfate exporter family transporter [Nonomuraea sp. 3-1Str]|uniref:YeiH family protein n=1 Tax=Nonomuraea sp. 3-1Str TaxID=2929801 RepID=UPI0028648A31|nr:putative sulfate exporter family transporter [Nonomuraea sp. 3-1Str]MDR8414835.1 putative sulfate exporter family transporter [Nonomuraea sp. 3-1Str]